jgi:demethylsterigmatocystin 6-O-methyltransferase
MRNILHDYPDAKAVAIIRNNVSAMSADSLLIIDEMIIPNIGVHSRATDLDMIMMTTLASTERTEKQWDVLLEEAGLKVLQKSTYDAVTGDSIIVTVPK